MIKISSMKDDSIDETLCEAFFVVGLPLKNSKLINDSHKFLSPCKHKDCSILFSYQPEIIYKYNKITKNKILFDITNSTASLCFPHGIKLCFSKNENFINPLENFVNVITNEKGIKYYVIMQHYYRKIEFLEFEKIFGINPLNENLLFKNTSSSINNNNSKNSKTTNLNEMQIYSSFVNNKFIYIPECIVLITRFPYSKEILKCLKSILNLK